MRLAVSLNGSDALVAGVPSTGFVGVHIVAYPGRASPTRLRAAAFYSPTEEETIRLAWTPLTLSVGDQVTVTCVDSAPTAHASESSTRTDKRINIRDATVARQLADIVKRFEGELTGLIEPVQLAESSDDAKKYRHAVGHVLAELLEQILEPLWNAHPSLQPEGWRDVGDEDVDDEPGEQ